MATRGGIVRRSAILLCKSESTPGTDPTPTLASNALIAYEVECNPMGSLEKATRKPIVGDAQLGEQVPITGIRTSTLNFKVPAHGAAAAGTAPDYGPALKACGLSETISTSTSVTYAMAATVTTCTFYFYAGPAADFSSAPNWRLYEMNGCVGNAKYVVPDNGSFPMWEFEFQGTYVAPVDVTDPGDPTLIEIVPPNCLNLGLSWTVDGGAAHAPRVKNLTWDLGNNVVARKDLNATSGVVAFILEDRSPTVSMQIEEELSSAGEDWWNACTSDDFGVLELGTIGSDAGNIHQVTFNRASLKNVSMTDADGVLSLDTEWTPAINAASLSTNAGQIVFT